MIQSTTEEHGAEKDDPTTFTSSLPSGVIAKAGKGFGWGLAGSVTSVINRLRRVPAPTSPKRKHEERQDLQPVEQQDETSGLPRKAKFLRGLKRWLVPSSKRQSSAITQPDVVPQHPIPLLDLPLPATVSPLDDVSQERKLNSTRADLAECGLVLVHSWEGDQGYEDLLDGPSDDHFPTLSELLEFPPPPPHNIDRDEPGVNQISKQGRQRFVNEYSSRGKQINRVRKNMDSSIEEHSMHAGNGFRKRTRGKLNERTVLMKPRYSKPQVPFISRPSSLAHPSQLISKSNMSRPTLSPPVGFPRNISPNTAATSKLMCSSPKASQSVSTPSQIEWPRLSKPLPLPPGWKFRPETGGPSRELDENPLPRPSRSASNGSAKKPASWINRPRPPSPRPTSSRDRSTHFPRRSFSSTSLCRKKNGRSTSFSSLGLGSIVGGHSSDSDVSRDEGIWFTGRTRRRLSERLDCAPEVAENISGG